MMAYLTQKVRFSLALVYQVVQFMLTYTQTAAGASTVKQNKAVTAFWREVGHTVTPKLLGDLAPRVMQQLKQAAREAKQADAAVSSSIGAGNSSSSSSSRNGDGSTGDADSSSSTKKQTTECEKLLFFWSCASIIPFRSSEYVWLFCPPTYSCLMRIARMEPGMPGCVVQAVDFKRMHIMRACLNSSVQQTATQVCLHVCGVSAGVTAHVRMIYLHRLSTVTE
jgi:hypothetical protein